MRTKGTTTANALRELIRAEMAHERAADEVRKAELEALVTQALEQHRRLTSADA